MSDDEVLGEARRLAQILAAKPPGTVRFGRAAFMTANDTGYRRSVAAAVENFCAVGATVEAREGVAAFVEKRKPNWTRPPSE